MRFKVVPPVPESLDRVEAVWRGVPIVPDAEESCCRRLMRDADVPAQDTAKEWLTFSRALGLAEEGPRGYARVRDGYDPDAFPARFREGVYAADETLAVLADADEPLSPDEVFDRLRDRVPAWERARSTDWQDTWRERVGRILDWAVLLGLAAERDGGYVRA
ncbi:hypothetical protein [Halosegnis marinus]|uniref:Uncharacterized protein n=1 Tax=Halosegnis marinus TaxID=3034023 RepID=A0ABD5ZLC4_9EURY|nr:hypothetical protein [Halosegnis sp. DT85]